MTSKQVELVQESFQSVQSIAREAAELFYRRLFQINPGLRPMFPSNMEEQGRKLMQMLALGVASLQRPDRIVPALEDLGRRHTDYGVTDEHFTAVGEALLWTLAQGLGKSFTDEVRDAWAAMYDFVASAMKLGMRQQRTAA